MPNLKALSDPRSLYPPGQSDLRRPRLKIAKAKNFRAKMPKSGVKPLTLAHLMPHAIKKYGVK